MKHQVSQVSPSDVDADALIVGVHRDTFGTATEAVDKASGGMLQQLIESGEFQAKPNELITLYHTDGFHAPVVVLVGLGESDVLDPGRLYTASGSAACWLSKKERQHVAFAVDADWHEPLVEAAVTGLCVGCVGQDLYRAEKKQTPFDRVSWLGAADSNVKRGEILGRGINLTRRLVNGSPCHIYPESFADEAATVAEEFGLEATIWTESELQQQRCGALLAVAQGSSRPPRLVMLRHRGGAADAPTLALVGKGVTFDSGGLSIKTTAGMMTMKADMAGAGTVLGAMQAIAELKLPVNVIGLMGLVENMLSRDAYRPSDVVTARSGKTIEIHNTDAEGRLVLADTLAVAVDQGADRIVDLATLTGACMVALGHNTAGVMTNDQSWCDRVMQSADDCGEQVWQLPMFAEFAEEIRSQVADLKNTGDGRWGGAITAAKLLEEFVDDRPWVHLDIAGPAFIEKSKPWIAGGASGAFVRTLVTLAENMQA